MKKYFLVVFGDFITEDRIHMLAESLSPVVDSKHCKFQLIQNSLLLHFGSEVSQEELFDFLTGIFYGLTETFILSELNDKMSLYMSEDTKAHLLDLENDTESSEIKIDLTKMNKSEFDEEYAEDFVNFLLDEFHTEVRKPTLNEILDKINEKGIKSLSSFEKEVLDSYGKE